MRKIVFYIFGLLFIFYFIFSYLFIKTIKPLENQIKIESDANTNYHSTLISAFFDISRVGRPKEEYFQWIKETHHIFNESYNFEHSNQYLSFFKTIIYI
jgi:hypothetical protein